MGLAGKEQQRFTPDRTLQGMMRPDVGSKPESKPVFRALASLDTSNVPIERTGPSPPGTGTQQSRYLAQQNPSNRHALIQRCRKKLSKRRQTPLVKPRTS